MNLRQCEIFRAVMTSSSITGAADRLGITQPAVSKMLAQMERDLGFPVFLRERRRLVPTPEAQALFKEVERAFLGLEHLTRFARDLKGLRQGHLVLGAPYAAAAGWLPGVASAKSTRRIVCIISPSHSGGQGMEPIAQPMMSTSCSSSRRSNHCS